MLIRNNPKTFPNFIFFNAAFSASNRNDVIINAVGYQYRTYPMDL